MAFKVPEQYRMSNGPLGSKADIGNNGAFEIQSASHRRKLFCIVSDGEGWEHVSIHAFDGRKAYTPHWDEMCQIKDLFWGPEDVVVQYHPAKSEYVNIMPHTLHLWRCVDQPFLTPPLPLV